jgi:hypothetical protein
VLPTDHELMEAMRRISRMKKWNAAVQSEDAATLWQHEPLMARVAAAACACGARNPGTGPTYDQRTEMAKALLIAFIQKGRWTSVENLVNYAADPLRRLLKEWTDEGYKKDPLNQERTRRRFLRLLRRSGLGDRATVSEISAATGTPREVVWELLSDWMLGRAKQRLSETLVRLDDGTVTAAIGKHGGKRLKDAEGAAGSGQAPSADTQSVPGVLFSGDQAGDVAAKRNGARRGNPQVRG